MIALHKYNRKHQLKVLNMIIDIIFYNQLHWFWLSVPVMACFCFSVNVEFLFSNQC